MTTISWLNHRIRHGLDANVTCGTLARTGFVIASGKGGRGRRSDVQGSVGPGTKRKWVSCRRVGYCRRSVARLLNRSAGGKGGQQVVLVA